MTESQKQLVLKRFRDKFAQRESKLFPGDHYIDNTAKDLEQFLLQEVENARKEERDRISSMVNKIDPRTYMLGLTAEKWQCSNTMRGYILTKISDLKQKEDEKPKNRERSERQKDLWRKAKDAGFKNLAPYRDLKQKVDSTEKTKQRNWQLKMRSEKRCIKCGSEDISDKNKDFCEYHRVKKAESNLRRYYKRKAGISTEDKEEA